MSNTTKGFHSMPPEQLREVAAKGGRSAHAKGTAHEWTFEEARAYGRKGGETAQRNKRATALATNPLAALGEQK